MEMNESEPTEEISRGEYSVKSKESTLFVNKHSGNLFIGCVAGGIKEA